jgi:putative oxidoreductase
MLSHQNSRRDSAARLNADAADIGANRVPRAWSTVVVRVVVGYGFMAHGFAKLSKGPDAFTAILHALGVPIPHVMAWATILVEVLGGFAVLVGAFVWVVSVPMVMVLLVALFTVHLPYGFSSIKLIAVTTAGPQFGPPGYETALLYIACLVALNLGGPGPLSVDGLVGRRSSIGRGTEPTPPKGGVL